MTTWHTLDSARTQWVDAPIDDDQLTELLEVAKDAVLAYAPAVDTATPDVYTATSAEPNVATVTLTPVGGFVALHVDVPGTGAFADEALFAIPAAYVPGAYISFASSDGRISVYTVEGSIATLRVSASAGTLHELDGVWMPATPFGDVPVAYRSAQLMQARNIWNSAQASPSGDFDGGGYGLTTFPLDWQVKQLLRPRSVFGGPVG